VEAAVLDRHRQAAGGRPGHGDGSRSEGQRIPCATFAGWLDREGWIKRFTAAAVPGAFLRVIEPGAIKPGDPVQILSRPDHEVTIAVAFRAVTLEPDLLPLLLTADGLAAEAREHAAARLGDRSARGVG
jgi:MOSC domain-containing protein YiiM